MDDKHFSMVEIKQGFLELKAVSILFILEHNYPSRREKHFLKQTFCPFADIVMKIL